MAASRQESWIASRYRDTGAIESLEIASSTLLDEVVRTVRGKTAASAAEIAEAYSRSMGAAALGARFAEAISTFVTLSEPIVREPWEQFGLDRYFTLIHRRLNDAAYDLRFDEMRREFDELKRSDPPRAFAAEAIAHSYVFLQQLVQTMNDPAMTVRDAILDAQRELTPPDAPFVHEVRPSLVERWNRSSQTTCGVIASAFRDLSTGEWLTFVAYLAGSAGRRSHGSAEPCFITTVDEELTRFLLPYVTRWDRP